MRQFQKITKRQFLKDCPLLDYNDIILPLRATGKSAGYDFYLLDNLELLPGQEIKLPTGLKCCMEDNDVLAILPRSSLGFKYYMRLANTEGIIDADYYDNPDNEGHIWIKIRNEGLNTMVLSKTIAIAQGIFFKYLLIDNDKPVVETRTGGLGSTTKFIA